MGHELGRRSSRAPAPTSAAAGEPRGALPEVAVPSVFAYVDYRAFLRDHFQASKRLKRHWSFRYFARKAQLASPNFLQLVMQGKRNLSATTTASFAGALGLDAFEAAFFTDLVALGQAESVAERNRAFERVAAHRRFREAKRLEGPLFEYLTHWYYPAVRELAASRDFRDDAAWVASQLLPAITVDEARAALVTLESLGMLVRDERGRLVRGEPSLTTGHEVRSLVVPAYHRQMIERAGGSVDAVPPDQRDISALTVCVRASSIDELKQRIRRFREEMLDRCDREDDPERVYQLCIQLFPLSKLAEPREPEPKKRNRPPTRA